MIDVCKVPSFAVWRWGTIHDCEKALRPVTPLLRRHRAIVEEYLKRLTMDGAMAVKVRVTLTCPDWLREYKFTGWSSEELCRAQSWGGWCKCHEEDYRNNVHVECDEKRRLLPWTFLGLSTGDVSSGVQ